MGIVIGYFHVACARWTASPLLEVWCGTDHSGWVLLAHRSLFLAWLESGYIRISISPPSVRKDGMPSCQAWLVGGQKKGEMWLIPVTYIGVVLIASLLAVTWVLECPASPLRASPSRFLPPLEDHVSRHRRIGHAYHAEMSLSKAHKFLRKENLSQGILWPVPFWGSPISAPRVTSTIVRSGNFHLDSNMAMLSP